VRNGEIFGNYLKFSNSWNSLYYVAVCAKFAHTGIRIDGIKEERLNTSLPVI